MTTDSHHHLPIPSPDDPLLGLAMASLERSNRRAVAAARRTLQDREQHVDQGRHLRSRSRAAHDDYLRLERELRWEIKRPKWLSAGLNLLLKSILVASEVGAGTTALYVAGDPLWLAVLTFTGVALATVLAGTHVGIHFRREEGESGGLVWLAAIAIVLGATMLGLYRYFTLGATFAILAFVTLMVGFGSIFVGYLWHDRTSEQIERARDSYVDLERQAEAEFNHPTVQRFERAEAELRLAGLEALHQAYHSYTAPPSALESQINGQDPRKRDHVRPPDAGTVDRLLAAVVGSEILTLTPKAGPGAQPGAAA